MVTSFVRTANFYLSTYMNNVQYSKCFFAGIIPIHLFAKCFLIPQSMDWDLQEKALWNGIVYFHFCEPF